jgi:orotate phosphoribosyltransferase
MSNYKEKIAKHLLNINAVVLKPTEPFTWSSGLKSPIYCDNRLTLSYPEVRRDIARGFVELIKEFYPNVDVIAGAATGGIAHAAWISELMNLPMIYVRGKAKGHGKQSQIEGVAKPGQNVVVVEDLISTGGSSLKVVDALKEHGCNVLGVAAIFTYGLDAGYKNFKEYGVGYETLTDYPTLLKVAEQSGRITEEELNILNLWRINPESEEWYLAQI